MLSGGQVSEKWAICRGINDKRGAHLVQLEAHGACDKTLGVIDGGLKGFPLWAEPEAVVDQLSIPAHSPITVPSLIDVSMCGGHQFGLFFTAQYVTKCIAWPSPCDSPQ